MPILIVINIKSGLMYRLVHLGTSLKGCTGKSVKVEQLEMNCLKVDDEYYEIDHHLTEDLVVVREVMNIESK